MAEFRAEKAGFAREAQQRMNSKFDGETAAKIIRWIRVLTPPSNFRGPCLTAATKLPQEVQSVDLDTFAGYLSDGLTFGYIIACLDSSKVPSLMQQNTWHISDRPLFEKVRQRERIGVFLTFLTEFGVSGTSQFQTDQLYEKTGVAQVVNCLRELGLVAEKKPGYTGPAKFWT